MSLRRPFRFLGAVSAWLLAAAATQAQVTFTRHPVAQTVVAGGTLQLSAALTSSVPVEVFWFRDGVIIPGATTANLTITNIPTSAAGVYALWARTASGAITISQGAQVTVMPRPLAGYYFGTVRAEVGFTGLFALRVRDDGTAEFLAYESRVGAYLARDIRIAPDRTMEFSASILSGRSVGVAVNLRGAIDADGNLSATMGENLLAAPAPEVAGPTSAMAGFYSSAAPRGSDYNHALIGPNGKMHVAFVVTSGAWGGTVAIDAAGRIEGRAHNNLLIGGSLDSATGILATTISQGEFPALAFLGTSPEKRTAVESLVNLSTRASISAAQPAVAAGFTIAGTQAKRVLVRGIGPSLAAFGVADALPAVRLEVMRGSSPLAAGNEWGRAANAAEIAAVTAGVGGFPLAADSRDAALLLTLEPGSYSAVVSGVGGATGTVLAEIYDATPGGAQRGERLSNLSSLATTIAGREVLAAGFTVSGLVPKRVLIRASGPSLRQFGVPRPALPQLRIYAGTTLAAENVRWSDGPDAPAITAAAKQVGAFSFVFGSVDCAMILNLAPGGYTAEVSNLSPSSSVEQALVELYELP